MSTASLMHDKNHRKGSGISSNSSKVNNTLTPVHNRPNGPAHQGILVAMRSTLTCYWQRGWFSLPSSSSSLPSSSSSPRNRQWRRRRGGGGGGARSAFCGLSQQVQVQPPPQQQQQSPQQMHSSPSNDNNNNNNKSNNHDHDHSALRMVGIPSWIRDHGGGSGSGSGGSGGCCNSWFFLYFALLQLIVIGSLLRLHGKVLPHQQHQAGNNNNKNKNSNNGHGPEGGVAASAASPSASAAAHWRIHPNRNNISNHNSHHNNISTTENTALAAPHHGTLEDDVTLLHVLDMLLQWAYQQQQQHLSPPNETISNNEWSEGQPTRPNTSLSVQQHRNESLANDNNNNNSHHQSTLLWSHHVPVDDGISRSSEVNTKSSRPDNDRINSSKMNNHFAPASDVAHISAASGTNNNNSNTAKIKPSWSATAASWITAAYLDPREQMTTVDILHERDVHFTAHQQQQQYQQKQQESDGSSDDREALPQWKDPAGIDLSTLMKFFIAVRDDENTTNSWPYAAVLRAEQERQQQQFQQQQQQQHQRLSIHKNHSKIMTYFPETLYIVDAAGLWTAWDIRKRTWKRMIRGRVEPTEQLAIHAIQLLQSTGREYLLQSRTSFNKNDDHHHHNNNKNSENDAVRQTAEFVRNASSSALDLDLDTMPVSRSNTTVESVPPFRWQLLYETVFGSMTTDPADNSNDTTTHSTSIEENGVGSGFPFVAWYGDFRGCNDHNWRDRYSIPIFTVCARINCTHKAFAWPNYKLAYFSRNKTPEQWRGSMIHYGRNYTWIEKRQQVVWRGALTGDLDNYQNPRWRLCHLAHVYGQQENVRQQQQQQRQDQASVMSLDNSTTISSSSSSSATSNASNHHHHHASVLDVGLVGIPPRHNGIDLDLSLVGGLVTSIKPMHAFQQYRAILDIDGNSWSSRFAGLLCYNSVILKVKPDYIEYFYYGKNRIRTKLKHNETTSTTTTTPTMTVDMEVDENDRLLPWKHYIPVRSDLQDLIAKAQFVMDPQFDSIIRSIIENANEWCQYHLTPSSLAGDILDIWQVYVNQLHKSNPTWQQVWAKTYKPFLNSKKQHFAMKLLS